jgi:hypothetical protein
MVGCVVVDSWMMMIEDEVEVQVAASIEGLAAKSNQSPPPLNHFTRAFKIGYIFFI